MGILIVKICNRYVLIENLDKSILDVTRIMRQSHVDNVDYEDNKNTPVGIITDRDSLLNLWQDDAINPGNLLFE